MDEDRQRYNTEDMRHCSRQRISCVNSKQTFIVSNDTHFLTILQIYPRIVLPQ